MVSVVILTWNRKDDLVETIIELRKSSYAPMEVIVVDNGSADGTPAIIKERFPDVIFIRLERNIGIAGYNTGMKKAKGKYIVLLDSDSFPESKAIERMVSLFESDNQVGAVAFDIHNTRCKTQDARFKNLQLATCNLQPFDFKKSKDVYGYNGAGVGIRRECLEQAGYLFEPYFLYFNEQDHAFRILQAGYRIKFHPDIVAYHKTSASSRLRSSAPYFYTRNLFWMIWRFYPVRYALSATFLLFFHASLSTMQQRTFIYMKAIMDAVKGFAMVLSSRMVINEEIIKRARIPIRWAFMAYK